MILRKYKDSDEDAVRELNCLVVNEFNSKDYPSEQIQAWTKNIRERPTPSLEARQNRFVAVEGDKIIGFSGYKNNGYVGALYVNPYYSGKGVGSKLLIALEDEARKKGVEQLHLKATITSKNFFIKHGYTLLSEGTHEIEGHHLKVFMMEKVL